MRGRIENEREAIERENTQHKTTQGQHPRDSSDRERERERIEEREEGYRSR